MANNEVRANRTQAGGSKLASLIKARHEKRDKGEDDKNLKGSRENRSVEILNRLQSSGDVKNSGDENYSRPKLSLGKNRKRFFVDETKLHSSNEESGQLETESEPVRKPQPTEEKTHRKKTKEDKPEIQGDFNFSMNYDNSLLLNVSDAYFAFSLCKQKDSNTEIRLGKRSIKRNEQKNSIFRPITNTDLDPKVQNDIANRFKKPSPDDEVLEAQTNALNEKVDQLKISKPSQPKSDTKIPKKTKAFKKIDLERELQTQGQLAKPHLSFTIIGHVDSGKSTLIGRLLFDFGIVDGRTMKHLIQEAERENKGSFALAWVTDQTKEERTRGVTADICATGFEIEKARFTAIDAPGHKDFVPQTINGICQADIALLVVDSINGEFESGFQMSGQTKEHTLLARNLGIENICVVVNKMDKENWSEQRFSNIREQMLQFLTGPEIGFSISQITFVPLSGLTGNNVVKRDPKVETLSWYRGPTLAAYLLTNSTSKKISRADSISQEQFQMPISDVSEVSNSEFDISGRISSGFIQPGQTIKISPSQEYIQVRSIKTNDRPVDVSIKGDIVLLTFKIADLTNISVEDIEKGDVILDMDSSITTTRKFLARLHLFNLGKPLLSGSPFVLFIGNGQVEAKLARIIHIEGSSKVRKHLVSNQNAEVELEVMGSRSLPISTYEQDKQMGRLVVRKEGVTIAAGIVLESQGLKS